jgi:Flp pilus assembly protein TadG
MRVEKFLTNLRHKEDGGALVEAALTLPFLITLLLGSAEFSRVAYASLQVVSAAKAGVSYGAQNGGFTGDTTGITYAAQHDVNLSGLQVTSISSSYVCSDGTAATGLNTDCASSHIEQTLTVKTQIAFSPMINVPGLPTQYTLKGEASQVCLQ